MILPLRSSRTQDSMAVRSLIRTLRAPACTFNLAPKTAGRAALPQHDERYRQTLPGTPATIPLLATDKDGPGEQQQSTTEVGPASPAAGEGPVPGPPLARARAGRDRDQRAGTD